MKKILYVVQGAGGGVSRYLVDIISNLDPSEFKVGVVYNSKFADDRFKTWRATTTGVQFFDVDTMIRKIVPAMELKSIKAIMKIIDEFQPDIVHAQSSKAGLTARISAKLKHVRRIVYTPHAYAFLSPEFSSKKRAAYTFAERVLSRHFTDMTINCSYSEHEHAIEKKIDRSAKLTTIANAVPPISKINRTKERQRLGYSNDEIVVGNLARVSPQKNPQLFDVVADAVAKLDSSIKFVWVGTNKDNRTATNVEYKGEMSNTQPMIGGMNLYLSTSLFEGLSYSLLEAASVGVPVLASNVPGNDEFIAGYDRAYGFELTDAPEKIAQQIVELVHDPSLQDLVPSAGGFEKMMRDTVAVYNG